MADPDRMPQAWVPRVLNGAIAVVLIALSSPIVVIWGNRSVALRVFLVAVVVPVLLVASLCVASALRPGSLGRAARRARARRAAR